MVLSFILFHVFFLFSEFVELKGECVIWWKLGWINDNEAGWLWQIKRVWIVNAYLLGMLKLTLFSRRKGVILNNWICGRTFCKRQKISKKCNPHKYSTLNISNIPQKRPTVHIGSQWTHSPSSKVSVYTGYIVHKNNKVRSRDRHCIWMKILNQINIQSEEKCNAIHSLNVKKGFH